MPRVPFLILILNLEFCLKSKIYNLILIFVYHLTLNFDFNSWH